MTGMGNSLRAQGKARESVGRNPRAARLVPDLSRLAPKVLTVVGALLAFLVLGSAGGVSGEPEPPSVRVFVTRDLRGWLFPCDCREGVLGGYPRRATVVSKRRPDLLLDAGDLVSQASPYDLLKLSFMLELNGRLGYDAVNVGRREAEFSAGELRRAAEESPVPLVSANLTDEQGEAVLPGHVLVTAGEWRFAVVGLVTQAAHPGEGLRVGDPAEALARELAAVRDRADSVVLLSALGTDEMVRALEAAPGVDLVLGGFVPKGTERLEQIAGVPCFLVTGKGQYLGEVDLDVSGARPRPSGGRRIVLTPSIQSEERVLARIRDFELSLGDLDLLGRGEASSPYAGATACAACHGEIHAALRDGPHARALSSLLPEKGRFDPQCLACHTTAPGDGGYVSSEATPEFAGVGCESCHGPSRRHAFVPLTESRPRTPGAPRATCMNCHEADHSRPFHRAERLAAIRHWKGKGEDR